MIFYERNSEGEKDFESLERVEEYNTQIIGFENIWFNWLSNEDVATYLSEFPKQHLKKCPIVQYQPFPHTENAGILGSFDTQTHEITIWASAAWEKCLGGREETQNFIFSTIGHEVGHNVYENMVQEYPDVAAQWFSLYESKCGFVSFYARTNEYEDFAETFSTYKNDPDMLRILSPEKYEFMRREVFFGKEYIKSYEQELVTKEISSKSTQLYKVSQEKLDKLKDDLFNEFKSKIDELANEALKKENIKKDIANILTDKLQEKLVGRIKNTNFNLVDVHNAKATVTNEGFILEGNFTAKHRENLVFCWSPWHTERGTFSVAFSPRIENGNLYIENSKPKVNFNEGDFPLHYIAKLFQGSIENKLDVLIKERLNNEVNGKPLNEIIKN